jgi:iron(III) transport system ATP-binding protein
MTIAFRDISHKFGNQTALSNIDLNVTDGEIVCILGPSGSGKSTLLRIAAGLEPVQNGAIYLGDQLMADASTNPPPEQRPIGLVFQDHVLFPHQTVAENIAFGLHNQSKAQRRVTVEEQLATVDLVDVAQRYPHTLSGGQQQRVALIRALATEPAVMLLDEPFASVDTPLRRKLREQARLTLKAAGTPTLMVTHDPEEAMDMADRILVLVDGQAVQLGTPEALWRSPKNAFVAQTIGGLQSIQGRVFGDQVQTNFGNIPISCVNNRQELEINSGESGFQGASALLEEGATVTLGIRPHTLELTPSSGPGVISDKRFLGQRYLTLVTVGSEQMRVETITEKVLPIGALVDINFASVEAIIYS